MTKEFEALTDPDYRVRIGAVVALAKRAAEPEVLPLLEARLDDEDLAVIEVAASALCRHAGAEGLERVLRAYASTDDNSLDAIDKGVLEVCGIDASVHATLRSIARRTPQDAVAEAALIILSDMSSGPAFSEPFPYFYSRGIIDILDGV